MTTEEVKIALGVDTSGVQTGLVNANSIITKSIQDTAKSLTKIFALNFTQIAMDGLSKWNDLTKSIADSWYDVGNIGGRAFENNRRAARADLQAARAADAAAAKAEQERLAALEKINDTEEKYYASLLKKRMDAAKTEEERNSLLQEHLRIQEDIALSEAQRLQSFRYTTDLEKRQALANAELRLDSIRTEIAAEKKRHNEVMQAAAAEKAAQEAAAENRINATMDKVNALGGSDSVYQDYIQSLQRTANMEKGNAKAGSFQRYQSAIQELQRVKNIRPDDFVKQTAEKNVALLEALVESAQTRGIKIQLPP